MDVLQSTLTENFILIQGNMIYRAYHFVHLNIKANYSFYFDPADRLCGSSIWLDCFEVNWYEYISSYTNVNLFRCQNVLVCVHRLTNNAN